MDHVRCGGPPSGTNAMRNISSVVASTVYLPPLTACDHCRGDLVAPGSVIMRPILLLGAVIAFFATIRATRPSDATSIAQRAHKLPVIYTQQIANDGCVACDLPHA